MAYAGIIIQLWQSRIFIHLVFHVNAVETP